MAESVCLSAVPDPTFACKFDKKLNLLILKQKNWFGDRIVQHHLSEIQSVRLKAYEHKQDEGDICEIGIMLVSGSYLRLNEPSTSFDRRNTKEIVSSIESFLNLHHLSM